MYMDGDSRVVATAPWIIGTILMLGTILASVSLRAQTPMGEVVPLGVDYSQIRPGVQDQEGARPEVPTVPIKVYSRAQPEPADPVDLPIQLDLPPRQELFRPVSEAVSRARIRERAMQRNMKAIFPAEEQPPLVPLVHASRHNPPETVLVVPDFVCYHPLYFEEKNTERYGWRVPFVQPVISATKFYADAFFLPYKLGAQPPWTLECNAGYHKPGDCVPYLFYLPSWSWAGAALQVGSVLGVIALLH